MRRTLSQRRRLETITIPKALQYAEDKATELFRCKVRRIREEEGGSWSEMRETQSIANIIPQIE